uniref:NADH-ubiquinone oxidoreductase chain 6 n=1 Tax=Pachybrachis suffrianii TaxID=1661973 RepID=A0A3G1GSC5_9CUCU|nr:NADH dehydrogenase subunit 6 [Pachybrachis suffrianii]
MVLIMISNAILFSMMKHPLSMGLILLVQTIFTSMLTGFMAYSFWFSYIMFLIMVGGMLILFMYMTSIASNEKFKFSWKVMFILLTLMMLMVSSLFIDSNILGVNSKPITSLETMEFYQPFFLNSYINYPHSIIYFMMVIYLLITLIAVVKITTKVKGSLRQKF